MSSNLPRYTLRVHQNLLDKFYFISSYNGRSVNKEIEQIMIKHVLDFEKEHGEIELDSSENDEK